MENNAERLMAALEFVRMIDEDMKIEVLVAFLYVAARGEATRKDVAREIFGGDSTSAYYALKTFGEGAFSKNKRREREGLEFLTEAPDEIDTRRSVWRLTPKGREFIRTVDRVMDGQRTRKRI